MPLHNSQRYFELRYTGNIIIGNTILAETLVPLFCENFCFFYTSHPFHQPQPKDNKGNFSEKKIMIEKNSQVSASYNKVQSRTEILILNLVLLPQ